MHTSRRGKSAGLRPAYQSPFRARWSLASALRKNVGWIVFAGVAVAAILVALLSRNSIVAPTPPTEQHLQVVDGDTLNVEGRRIRLHGIDAPERGQACTKNGENYDCGKASREYLTYLLTGEKVICERRSQDKWGREVATCTAGGKDIAALMVRQGWAVAYTEYSTAYVEDEQFARANDMGMWAKDFMLPKEWRNRQEK